MQVTKMNFTTYIDNSDLVDWAGASAAGLADFWSHR
jgi:hypothetical protein